MHKYAYWTWILPETHSSVQLRFIYMHTVHMPGRHDFGSRQKESDDISDT